MTRSADHRPTPDTPRIVNPVFFIRGIEPREPVDLLEPVERAIDLLHAHDIPGTFLLQYDALLQDRFVDLLRSRLRDGDEIGCWLELVQPLVERAGAQWRGRWAWDWHSQHAFPIGYAPAERERMVDVYMNTFRETFGRLPASVGSWVLDAHTLAYLSDHYGIEAACNCKDQIGTDGYTLWGGYWNQAYYPSRRNACIPAQSAAQQIPVPIFRMLGSDPVRQYALDLGSESQGVVTLEPVYQAAGGGGCPEWVRWFFDVNFNSPCLGFAYAQMGQENSFGWPAMRAGLEDQFALLAGLRGEGKVRLETLGASGRWFRNRFRATPATCVVALSDSKGEALRSVWYDSRHYRANLFWQDGAFCFRDIQMFDERYPERYLNDVCTVPDCVYDALPVVDGYRWSDAATTAALRLVDLSADRPRVLLASSEPEVAETGRETLRARWSLAQGGSVTVGCAPERLAVRLSGAGPGLNWGLELEWSEKTGSALTDVGAGWLGFRHNGYAYEVGLRSGRGELGPSAGSVAIVPENGRIELALRSR